MLNKDVLTKIITNKGHNKKLTPNLIVKYVIKIEEIRSYRMALELVEW